MKFFLFIFAVFTFHAIGNDRTHFKCSKLAQLYLDYYDDFDYKKQMLDIILLTMNYISNVNHSSKVLTAYAQKDAVLEESEQSLLIETFKKQITQTLTQQDFYEKELSVLKNKHKLWLKVFKEFSKSCLFLEKSVPYQNFENPNSGFQLSCYPNFIERLIHDIESRNFASIKAIEFLSYDKAVSFELKNLFGSYNGQVGRQLQINDMVMAKNEEHFKNECINSEIFISFKNSFVKELYE